jgi:hypothetical protein
MRGLPDNVYLDGYWQSEKYFSGSADALRSEITLKRGLSKFNAKLADQIERCNSICLHVRRGDYLAKKTMRQIGVCDMEYYKNGIEYVASRLINPKIFIFTDDPHWVSENIDFDFDTSILSHNGNRGDCHDLMLMKSCKHFVISNSSFSWWGAWLSEGKGKTVIAPKRWFAGKAFNREDIHPRGWITM